MKDVGDCIGLGIKEGFRTSSFLALAALNAPSWKPEIKSITGIEGFVVACLDTLQIRPLHQLTDVTTLGDDPAPWCGHVLLSDERLLMCAFSHNQLKFVELSTGELFHSFPGHRRVLFTSWAIRDAITDTDVYARKA